MKITRLYSEPGCPAADQVEWKRVDVAVDQKDHRFAMSGVEVPAAWSDNAAQILASKYFRKAGVPERLKHSLLAPLSKMPEFLWRSTNATPDGPTGSETSARQVFHRLAGCWTYWAWLGRYVTSEEDARALYDELFLTLARQVWAPNSPQWFNSGLHWAYGIEGPASGQWAVDWDHHGDLIPDSPTLFETPNSYERPQPHACFIQPVSDDLVNPGGIMDLWTREVRLFKYGSGTGSNFSQLRGRGELLSGGGRSSGMMSFLRIGDRAAGAIKSGGTTRRAAKMVIVDADHPEVEEFVDWKMEEEYKAAAMSVGAQLLRAYYLDQGTARDDPFIAVPPAAVDRMEHGFEPKLLPLDWECEAIDTVSGQNANNSVRVTNEFMELSRRDPSTLNWDLTARTTGETVKSVNAKQLLDRVARAAWASGDPGMQFHDTINEWHTCPNDGPIRASNPCSEFMFLDNNPCNLASLNLVSFLRPDGTLDLEAFEHVTRLTTIVLDVSVHMASFPSREIALGSYRYRTLGLGYMNLGALLMRRGLPYDSDEGRALAAALTALMTGLAYRTSAELAVELGPFPRWHANADAMRRVLRNHARAAGAVTAGQSASYEGLTVQPYEVDRDHSEVWERARNAWEKVQRAESFRNAQVTLLAPTGTISFVTDCFTGDTLVAVADGRNAISFKQLANERKDVAVYASDNGRTVIKTMRNPRAIKSSNIVRVLLDDGSSVRCTPEHQFMLHDGTYKPAFELQPGESLMRFESKIIESIDDRRKSSDGTLYVDRRRFIWMGPEYGGNRNRGRGWKAQYKMIGTQLFPSYTGRSGGLIHHLDEDPLNDLEANLHYCTTHGEHQSLHWQNMTAEERSEFGKRRIANRDKEKNREQLNIARLHSSTSEARAKALAAYPSQARSAKMLEANKLIPAEVKSQRMKRAWETRRLRDPNNEAAKETWKARKEHDPDNNYVEKALKTKKKRYNHKVISIEPDGFEITYCGEVDDIHNFSIITSVSGDLRTGTLSGITVHNCDTTGLEPDYALVKHKHLAGGDSLRIVNDSVGPALRALGYDETKVSEVVALVLHGATAVELPLEEDHRAVFHCVGELAPLAHVRMVAAVQPFLSGAVSKTVNLPNEATIRDVEAVFRESWRLGLKAVAPYRDGSKLNQPLSAAVKVTRPSRDHQPTGDQLYAALKSHAETRSTAEIGSLLFRGVREYPPWRREGYTQKVQIGNHAQSTFLTVNRYPDGRPCEAFIELGHEGSTLRSMADIAAMMLSIGLQYGVPVKEYVDRLTHTKFEPAGIVEGHDRIKFADSITDFIGRELGIAFLGREDLANVPGASVNGERQPEMLAASPIATRILGLGNGTRTGAMCPNCENLLRIDGTCRSCDRCGFNTGCGGG